MEKYNRLSNTQIKTLLKNFSYRQIMGKEGIIFRTFAETIIIFNNFSVFYLCQK